jgi:hypothetical protein
MTGSVLGEITAPQGAWSVVQDGGHADRTGEHRGPGQRGPRARPSTVEARTANTETGPAAAPFTAVSNGVKFAKTGRYIEVRATLSASPVRRRPGAVGRPDQDLGAHRRVLLPGSPARRPP